MRQTMWMAMLVLVTVPLGGMSVQATSMSGGSCSAAEDDPGMGGTSVECQSPCGRYSELLVAVSATDADATVAGTYNCGGQGAMCSAPAPTCASASAPTSYAGNGTCKGKSDEFWSSMVAVACVATAGLPNDYEPQQVICKYVPDFPGCKPPTVSRSMVETLMACLAQASGLGLLDKAVRDGLFPSALEGRAVERLTSFAALPDGRVVVVRYDAGDGECKFTEERHH